MKRNFTFLMAAFALMVSMMMPLGMKGQTRTTVADQMMASDLAATSTTYTDFSGVTLNSDAVYAGQSAKDSSGNIQLRSKNSNSGIVSTTSGGKIKSVKITVASENSNTIDVYGSNTAYTSAANLYSTSGNNNQGTKLGSLTSTGTITVTGDYAYVGVRSNSGAVYISSIEFTWESTGGGTPAPTPCTVTFNPGNGTCDTPSVTEDSGTSITLPTASPSAECANLGWTFAGWATQSISETTTVPTLLTGSYTISGNATLYAVYRVSDGGPASTTANMNFSSGSYSNSTITWTIPDIVSILQEKHNGQTAPNSSYVGSPRWYSGNMITITPSVTVTSISVTTTTEGYATALANSTYTNATATASDVNVTITPTNGSDAIVIVMGGQSRLSALSVSYASVSYIYATAPSCSAQQQVATPTFSPAAGTYTEAQNVTISCTTSDATIHYTTDGSTPTASSPTYSSAIAVSSTTTIKAIAVKEEMTNSAVAEATYTIEGGGGDGTIYTLYSGNLVEGDYIIYYSGRAMKNTVSSNRLEYKEVTPSNDRITTSDDAIIWHIAPSGNYWTIYNEAVDKYAASTGTKNQAQLLSGDTDDKSLWTVEGNSTYEFVNKKNNANNVNDHLRNNGSYGFACYSSETGGALSLYRSTAPSIVANQTIELAHDATFGAFDYSITNPVDGTTLTATSNADWITNVTVGTEQVTFTTTANTTGLERTGTIVLSYDGAQNKTVTVTQAAVAPVLETTNVPSTPFAYTGTAGSFDFTITNPVDGAITTATSTNAWITNVAVSGNTVSFQVAQNDGLARSGEITLTYAKNGTTLATASVTINQDSNPVLPGGADNPYTVAQAVDATPSSGTSDLVYVKGVVSQIVEIEVMQYHNARYYISDDGSTSSTQLLAFYGRNINNTDFLSEDELLVGDSVVICGQLQMYNDKAELGAGNYIVYLHRDIDPVTFSPVSCVTTSGTYVSLYSNVFDEWDAEIYYTTDGSEPSQSNGTYYDVWSDLITLTETTTIKAVAYVPDLDKYSSFTQATYTIVDPSMPGWVGNPYTVSQAIEAIDAASGNNIKGAYVQGTISRISQIELEQYFNATYFISDSGLEQNELQVYRGKYLSQGDFSSLDDIQVGDQVIVYGDLTLYNNTTHEFKPKNYIYDLQRSSSIIINQNHLDVDCNATAGTIAVSYSADLQVNIDIPTVQLCDAQGNAASYDWLSVSLNQDDEWNLEYAINANDGASQRTAYLKVSCQNVVSNLVTITQSEYQPDFATLPFTFDGGLAAAESTTGLKPAHLGSDYASSPKLKFNNPNVDGNITMSSLVLKINEVPGVLTYDIKGNVMVGGTFKVQQSSNGITYSDVASYSGLANESLSVTIDNLSPSTRYIRWIYVTKNKGNVGVGNIHLYKPILTYDLLVNNPMDGDTQIGAISANPAGPSIPAGTDVVLSISYDNNSYYFVEWVVTDDSDNPVAVTDNHFIMPAANVTVTATLVSADTPCAFAFSVNGQMGDQQSGTVGNTIQMPECSNINFNGQTFIFLGWTTNANDIGNLLAVGSSFTLNQDVTFHAVFRQQVSGLEAEKHFAKVTRELQDWSGDYLIVYEDEDVAFNGSLQTLDAASNTVEVTISNGIIIASSDEVNSAKFTIAAVEGGYSIKSASGKYIGRGVNDNGMDESTEYGENYVNEISYNEEEGEIDIVGSDGAHLRFNSASNQNRFRYYKSSSYTGQKAIQLYKYVGSVNNLYTRIFMNETADNITIEGPSIIPDGSVLNVASITNNLGADRLLVDEGGQLVTSNSVNASVRKSITPYQQQEGKDNYYLVASPVDDLNPATAGMTDDNFDLYFFDQAFQGAEWRNYKAEDSDHYHFNLEAGKGYLYANDYGGFINMGGTMAATAADVTITKVSGKALSGWNLIGNPYPCNVTIDKPFYRLAEGGAVLATEPTDNTVAIAPMEGVFVCADGTETVSFTKAPSTSTAGGRNLLRMSVSRSSKGRRVETDNAIVRFGEGAMLRKLVLNQELSQLYVAQEGTDYAIVNAEAEGELPVSFRAAANGSYTFSVAAEGVTMRYLHLIDHKTGTDVDLLQTPSYTFEASMGDFECRFKLVFACGDTNDGSETFAYYNGSQWMVSNEGKATLQVVDMMGRVLSSQNINGNAEVSIDRAAGVYLLRLIDGSDVKVQKIIIK